VVQSLLYPLFARCRIRAKPDPDRRKIGAIMITQGTLKYQVIGNPKETRPEYSNYTRVWLQDVNRHFFDAFPAKSTMHLDDETGEYYHIKVFRRRNTEIWLTCHEDDNGNRYGTSPAESSIPELPAEVQS
jgi:hypothetical protein